MSNKINFFSYLFFNKNRKMISKDSILLFLFTGLKSIFMFLTFYFLANYLGPKLYGDYTLAISILAVVLSINEFGLGHIITREITLYKNKISEILGSSYLIRFIGGILLMIITILYSFLKFGIHSNISISILFLSPVIIINSLKLLESYYISTHKNKIYTLIQFVTSFLFFFGTIILIKFNFSYKYFLFIYTIEALFSSLVLVLHFNFFIEKIKNWKVNFKKSIIYIKESWPLMLFSLASVINYKIDHIFIGTTLPSSTLGNYAVAAKISDATLIFPLLIGKIIYPVLINRHKNNYSSYKGLIFKSSLISFTVGIFIVLIINVNSNFVINNMFGIKYQLAPSFLRAYIYTILPYFLFYLMGYLFFIEKLVRYTLYFSSISILLNIVLNYIFLEYFGVFGTVYALILSSITSNAIALIILNKKTNLFK